MKRGDLVAALLSSLTRLLAGVTARSTESLPAGAQCVFFANHTSHLDAVVLWSALPRERRRLTRPVAAMDYWNASRLRRYLAKEVFNAVLIDRAGYGEASGSGGARGALKAIHDMLDALGESHSLILFPEGTRGTGETLGPFKAGLFHIAKRRPDLALVPVYMENLNRILPKGEVLPAPLLSSISFGAAITLRESETKEEFLERARQSIEGLRPI